MKKLKLIFVFLILAALFSGAVRAAEFNRSCSVTGGSAQRLSTVLTTCGYTGAYSVRELTITNPDDAANDLYVGRSDVDATNGVKYVPGASRHRMNSDITQIYLFVSSTQNVYISVSTQ